MKMFLALALLLFFQLDPASSIICFILHLVLCGSWVRSLVDPRFQNIYLCGAEFFLQVTANSICAIDNFCQKRSAKQPFVKENLNEI